MNEYVLSQKLARIEKQVEEVTSMLKTFEEKFAVGEKLWANSDIARNWKVSNRTLASWRKEQRISYIKIGGKIYYTPSNRNEFLEKYGMKLNAEVR